MTLCVDKPSDDPCDDWSKEKIPNTPPKEGEP